MPAEWATPPVGECAQQWAGAAGAGVAQVTGLLSKTDKVIAVVGASGIINLVQQGAEVEYAGKTKVDFNEAATSAVTSPVNNFLTDKTTKLLKVDKNLKNNFTKSLANEVVGATVGKTTEEGGGYVKKKLTTSSKKNGR